MDILTSIDRATAGVCPCGADPRPGSAYCSNDCTPTYRAEHTTSDVDGTAMRWRPDLVDAVDDTRLTLVAEYPVAGHHGAVYEIAGSDSLHLRLDDGHRFVGCDIARENAGDPSVEPGLRRELDPVWQRLERELTDRQRLESDDTDPWAALGHSCPCGCSGATSRRLTADGAGLNIGRFPRWLLDTIDRASPFAVGGRIGPPPTGTVFISTDDDASWQDIGHAESVELTFPEQPVAGEQPPLDTGTFRADLHSWLITERLVARVVSPTPTIRIIGI